MTDNDPLFIFRLKSALPFSAAVTLEPRNTAVGQILGATIRGPFCRFANTLPANTRLKPHDAITQRMSGEIMEPCYWTPELPFQYVAQIEWLDAGGARQQTELWLALKRFGARGQSLNMNGQRYVFRGMELDSSSATMDCDWNELRHAHSGLIIPPQNTNLIKTATEQGIPLLFKLTALVPVEELSALTGQHTAALGIIVPAEIKLEPSLHAVLDPLLMIRRLNDQLSEAGFGELAAISAERSNFGIMCTLRQLEQVRKLDHVGRSLLSQLPLFIEETLELPCQMAAGAPLLDRRAACDRLQAKAAGYGDFAGYCITTSTGETG